MDSKRPEEQRPVTTRTSDQQDMSYLDGPTIYKQHNIPHMDFASNHRLDNESADSSDVISPVDDGHDDRREAVTSPETGFHSEVTEGSEVDVLMKERTKDNNDNKIERENHEVDTDNNALVAEIDNGFARANLSDFEPPMIEEIEPENVNVKVGLPFEVKARFAGRPAPTITWTKDKMELVQDVQMIIDESDGETSLKVAESSPNDSGRYTLIIENEHGRDTCVLSVTIENVPSSPCGVPAVTNITPHSVTLSWYGPAYDGGSAVTGYKVEMCDVTQVKWVTLSSTCQFTSYQVQDLSPDHEYIFRVSAGNKHGFSHPGNHSDPVVTVDRTYSTLAAPSFISPLPSPLSPPSLFSEELPFQPKMVALKKDVKFHDDYYIGTEIGRGKFGKVFTCVDRVYGRELAAKFIKVKPSEKKEVHREIEVMNSLRHPKLLMLWDAYESPRELILVMEHVAGGELFERVIDNDYELTEKECIHFMRQIIEGVLYMHSQSILHLDLKPENIICVSKNSNEVKIIDFGLARKFDTKTELKEMIGTPEFVAPEVINYDGISFATDVWSIGVICYILLSGLSPFLGDNETETLSNVTMAEWDFEDESFDEISDDAKDFIEKILIKNPQRRLQGETALSHQWLAQDVKFMRAKRLSTDKHKRFMARRKWQKTGNAIRAVGRISAIQRAFSTESRSKSSNSVTSSEEKADPDNTTSKPSKQIRELGQMVSEDSAKVNFKNEAPLLLLKLRDTEVPDRGIAKFITRVKVIGDGPSTVTWTKNGLPIADNETYNIVADDVLGRYTLVIRDCVDSVCGLYACKVEHQSGSVSSEAKLMLKKPEL